MALVWNNNTANPVQFGYNWPVFYNGYVYLTGVTVNGAQSTRRPMSCGVKRFARASVRPWSDRRRQLACRNAFGVDLPCSAGLEGHAPRRL